MPADTLEQVVSLCKRRGFIFPGSAIYGGLANSWDYGPLGVELLNNVKRAWWDAMVYQRDDIEGIDAAIIMNRKVWKYSGHEATFNDPLVDNKLTKKRYRLDHLLEAQTASVIAALAARASIPSNDSPEEVISALTVSFMANPSDVPGYFKQEKVIDPDSGEPGDWTEPRAFNLMFDTHAGAIKNEDNKVYLRPETAQGIYVNFKHVLETMRRKLPFGIAQVGKSFRNEITPGNFIFRTREFEQMEMQFFIKPPPYAEGDTSDEDWHDKWLATRYNWFMEYGIAEERLRQRTHARGELAHYAKAAIDIEYSFPGSLGFSELEGTHNRTDYDLTAHSKEVPNDVAARERLKLEGNPDTVENLTYYDQQTKEHVVPYVIETAVGPARTMLAFLCEAYCEEATKEIPEADLKKYRDQLDAFLKSAAKNEHIGEEEKEAIRGKGEEIVTGLPNSLPATALLLDLPGASKVQIGKKLKGAAERILDSCFRRVLKLDPRLSPIKAAVLPLKRNAPEIVALAKRIRHSLSQRYYVVYDDTGAIGKLYRRQDEIGTPFCITVDFESLEDKTVTLRERDSMQQRRVHINELAAELGKLLNPGSEEKIVD